MALAEAELEQQPEEVNEACFEIVCHGWDTDSLRG